MIFEKVNRYFSFLLFYFKNIFKSTIIYFEIKARDMQVQVIRNEKEGKEKTGTENRSRRYTAA